MKFKSSDYRTQLLAAATPELGYGETPPPASTALRAQPTWSLGAELPDLSALKQEFASGWSAEDLREQIRDLGVQPQGRSRLDLATQLVETYIAPERLELVIKGLREEAQELFLALLLDARLRRWNPANTRLMLFRPTKTDSELLHQEIVDSGLELYGVNGFFISDIILAHLPPLYAPLLPEMEARPPRRVIPADPYALVSHVQQFLGMVQSGDYPLRVQRHWTPTHGTGNLRPLVGFIPTPESAQLVRKTPLASTPLTLEMMAPDPLPTDAALDAWQQALAMSAQGVEFLYHLLRAVGVLRPGSPVRVEPAALESFLALPPGSQLAILLQHYAALSDWDVSWPAWRAGDARAQWAYRSYQGFASYDVLLGRTCIALRNMVLDVLAILPHSVWLSFDMVVDIMAQFIPMSDAALQLTLRLLDARGSWDGFLRHYLEALLRGPLHWLGFAEIGLGADSRLQAFRLQQLQAIIWRRQPEVALRDIVWDARRAFRWQSETETLLIAPPVPVAVLQFIQRWAQPAGADGTSLKYRLDVARLHAAFEAGETPETLHAAWAQHVGASTPALVGEWWARWWARYGHIQLYPRQTVLTVDNAMTLKELQLARRELREALLGMINERTALLDSAKAGDILAAMQRKGYMPKEEA